MGTPRWPMLLVLICSLLLAPAGWATGRSDCALCRLGDAYFETVGDAESVPDNNITALAQDHSGLLWIGTPSGLVRYDGYRFRRFDLQPGSDGEVRGVFVRTLLVAADGRLWMGTDADGLWQFDPLTERFAVFRHDPDNAASLSHDNIRALAEDADGRIWIGTREGLNYYDPSSRQIQRQPQRLGDEGTVLDDRILALLIDRSGALWVGAWNGLSRRPPGAERFERVIGDLPARSLRGVQILSLRLLEDGRIGVGTAQIGSFLLNADGSNLRVIPAGADSNFGIAFYSLAMLQPTVDELWMGGFGGIMVIDAQSGRLLRQLKPDPSIASSLSHAQVRTMLLDQAGHVWIGGYGGGLQRHDPSNQAIRVIHHSPNRPQSLSSPSVQTVLELASGEIWVGTRESGVDVLDPELGRVGGWRADAGDPDALSHPMILSMAQTADGAVWVSTLADLHRFDSQGQRFRRYPTAQGLSGNTVRRLLPDQSGDLWIGSNAGLMRWSQADDQIRSIPDRQGARDSTDINALAQGADGRLWVGAASGLYTVEPGGETLDEVPGANDADRELLHATVVGLLIDSRQQLWIDTNNGLLQLHQFSSRGAEVQRVAHVPGTPVEPFGANLLEDARGRIWTHHHLYDPATDLVHELTRADGADLGTGWYRSYTATRAGLLLFGGSNGLMLVDPGRFQPWRYRPPLVISELRVDGQIRVPGEYGDGLVIDPDNRGMQIEFAALDYSAPLRNRYRYRLRGFDEEWTEADAGRRLASYNNLWPGDYQLEVLGSNRVGEFVQQPLLLPIRVLPAYWQTPWFAALVALAAALALFAGYRWKTARLRSHQQELALLVESRTEQLYAAKQRAESALEQLQETQQQLVEAEKLASLGQLVAGVAHEINTPLGTALTAASLAHDQTEALKQRVSAKSLRQQDLNDYLQTATQAQALIASNLTRAAQLVRSFKQLSLDRSREERAGFDLAERLEGLAEHLRPSWRGRPIELIVDCPQGVHMDSYPGSLGQVINCLCHNAVEHAYADTDQGQMHLQARLIAGNKVRIVFSDDGKGIEAADLAHIFEPFYTTRRGSGSIGLGLQTAFNLVHARLGGRISVESTPGQGSAFTVEIPLTAPAGSDSLPATSVAAPTDLA